MFRKTKRAAQARLIASRRVVNEWKALISQRKSEIFAFSDKGRVVSTFQG